MTNILPFGDKLNKELRTLYLKSISTPISYDEGKTWRSRARGIPLWESIEECKNPVNVLEHVKNPLQDIWFWSDLHFGHNNIIKFSDRPYVDIYDMDEKLIYNFNQKVKVNDISIWVGDVSFKSSQESKRIMHRLNGYKILIVGNHDFEKKKGVKAMAFDEVHLVYNLQFNDTVVAFTHYPMDNLPLGWFNVHGHVHKNGHHADEVNMPTHYNVNCEFLDYKPINMEQLIARINP